MKKGNETGRKAIGERIKELRKAQNFSQVKVASDLSITQAAYSRIENSSNGIVVEHIIRLSGLYEVTTDYILKGNNRLIEMSTKNGFMPYVPTKAHAGFVKNYRERINYEDQDWFRIPGFNPTLDQILFEVEGNSMVPTVLDKEILICQVQPRLKNVLNGTLAIVVTDSEVLVKRVHKVEDKFIVLQNDNPAEIEKEKKLDISKIEEMFIVVGKITGALVPHHQVVSRSKMESLEESVEMLKKEMFILNKKIKASWKN